MTWIWQPWHPGVWKVSFVVGGLVHQNASWLPIVPFHVLTIGLQLDMECVA